MSISIARGLILVFVYNMQTRTQFSHAHFKCLLLLAYPISVKSNRAQIQRTLRKPEHFQNSNFMSVRYLSFFLSDHRFPFCLVFFFFSLFLFLSFSFFLDSAFLLLSLFLFLLLVRFSLSLARSLTLFFTASFFSYRILQ